MFFSRHLAVPINAAAHVTVNFANKPFRALIDTGASCCLVSESIHEQIKLLDNQFKVVKATNPVRLQAISASNQQMTFKTELKLHFKINYLSWDFNFYVVPNLPVPIILGIDFLAHTKAVINVADKTITFPYKQPLVLSLEADKETAKPTSEPTPTLGDNLTQFQKDSLNSILGKFKHTITKKLGRTNVITYKIQMRDGHKVRCRPYQFSPPKTAILREHINELLANGVIKESNSQFSSPAFCVPKKGNKTRMVINYRALNQGLTLEATPMPTVESAFQHLSGAKFFTLLDLNSAYNQIPLAEESKHLTSFVVPWAQYEFQYVPFGLASGSMVLMDLVNRIFGDIKFKFLFAFFDDIVVYSNTFEEHLQHVECVLSRLQNAGLTVNPSKMIVGSDQIEFLGHIISNNTLSLNPEKTRPIDQFPTPKNLKQLSRFLGMTAYYSRFIQNYASISAPLNYLKKKDIPFNWGGDQEQAFNTLKAALTASPVLKMPDFNKEFVLHTDASRTSLGAVLSQEHQGHLFPVAYASRATNGHEKNYGSFELEALGIVYALEKFRVYLEHREFKLHTDNSALSWLLNHPRQIGKIGRWITTINSFKFTVTHVKGKDNTVADCLSRLFEEPDTPVQEPTASVQVLCKLPEVFQDIHSHQQQDPYITQQIKLVKTNKGDPNFSIINNILVHKLPNQTKSRVVIPQKLFPLLFKFYHEAPTAGHLGIFKTLQRIQPHFWAKDLKQTITDMVRSCKTCQLSKPAQNTKVGELVSEVATRPFEKVFIDHTGPYPTSEKGNKYLLTIVDSFSKYTVFLPARNTAARTTVRLLKTGLFSYFGFPKYLVTDNVPGFRSKEMTQMCLEFGITQITTAPYHPQSNISERVNRNLKTALRLYHNQNHTKWDSLIHLFQISFNSAVHESTKLSPASLFLGYNIKHPLELAWNLDELLGEDRDQQSIQQKWSVALENLTKARQGREQSFNQGRKPNPFKVGDWVVYRLNNMSKAQDKVTAKLLQLYSKPCVIQAFTSPVSVTLIDPSSGKVVRRAHITQLKRYFKPKTEYPNLDSPYTQRDTSV